MDHGRGLRQRGTTNRTTDRAHNEIARTQIAGFAHCPTNPWYPISVVLDAPLGNRQVFDGSVYPAELQTWPPDPDSLDP